MKPQRFLGPCLCLILSTHFVHGQDKINIKFGKITPADFAPVSPVIDSGSDAIVLADIGSSDFEGSNRGDFSIVYKRFQRILIKKRTAFDEATVKVPLFSGNYETEEKFENFEASTYNLENGHIVESKLDKTAVFKDKYDKYRVSMKFSLSNVKEGSIIEYKYSIRSPFWWNIRNWHFQREYPVLWSEYNVSIPPVYNFFTTRTGSLPYSIDTVGKYFKTYAISESGDATTSSSLYSVSGDVRWARWAIKDVPAFHHEQYLACSKTYLAGLQFQLHSIKYGDNTKLFLKDWYSLVNDLMKDPEFGEPLGETNSFFHDELKKVVENSTGVERARRIYKYVRDNFTCTDDDSRELSAPLKKTFQSHKGNVADINLLLTAMLIDQGFDAHPVLLSTKDNGIASESAALLTQFNYVIARVKIDTTFYLLDASINRLGFGRLAEKCFNGSGRLVSNPPILIPLSPDSLAEEKSTLVFVANDEKDGVSGSFTSNKGYYESMEIRDKLTKIKPEEYLKDLAKSYSSDVEVTNPGIDSLKSYDDPIAIHYDFKSKFDEDVVYFNPLLSESVRNNPFTAAKRTVPVEMPFKTNEVYVLNMEIPKGYKVDELPKSVRIKLNDNEGMFEYLIENSGQNIQFRCHLLFNKANFQPDDYQTLRDFYSYVVKKEADQIVFKKVK